MTTKITVEQLNEKLDEIVDKQLNKLSESCGKNHKKGVSEQDVDIDVENPGILEVPEGKDVNDLGMDHFKDLIERKGWEEISKALTNLNVWNKERDPELSNWADDMQQKLSKWVEDKREENPDFAK